MINFKSPPPVKLNREQLKGSQRVQPSENVIEMLCGHTDLGLPLL